jgi:hypothetical protein
MLKLAVLAQQATSPYRSCSCLQKDLQYEQTKEAGQEHLLSNQPRQQTGPAAVRVGGPGARSGCRLAALGTANGRRRDLRLQPGLHQVYSADKQRLAGAVSSKQPRHCGQQRSAGPQWV